MNGRAEPDLVSLPARDVDRAPPLVYGPVHSRRFGRSLGINLLPQGIRLCTYDCSYCQCGGERARHRRRADPPFPSLASLERDLVEALTTDPAINDICFAGAGEPTLHPRFREALLLARTLRDRLAPRATVTVLSNGVAAGKATVRGALALADRAVLKLDAARDDLLRALNATPRGLSARRLIEVYARMMGVETQTLLVRGAVDNATPGAIDALGEALRCIHPRRAHLGTITRAPAATPVYSSTLPLSVADLDAAAARLRTLAPGIEVIAY